MGGGRTDFHTIRNSVIGFLQRGIFKRKHSNLSYVNNSASDLHLLTERGIRLLLIHSEADEGLDYLHIVLGKNLHSLSLNNKIEVEIIKGANHTFTLLWSQERLLKVIQNWTEKILICQLIN